MPFTVTGAYSWCCSSVIVRVFRKRKLLCKSSFSHKTMTTSAMAKIFISSDTEAWRPPHTIDCRLKMHLAKEFMSNLKLQKQTFACPLQEETEVVIVILHQSVKTLSQLSLNNFQPFIPEEAQGSASRYPEFPNSLWYILKYAFPLLLTSKLSVCIL